MLNSLLEGDVDRQRAVRHEPVGHDEPDLMLSLAQLEYVKKVNEIGRGMRDIESRLDDLRSRPLDTHKQEACLPNLEANTDYIMSNSGWST